MKCITIYLTTHTSICNIDSAALIMYTCPLKLIKCDTRVERNVNIYTANGCNLVNYGTHQKTFNFIEYVHSFTN